MKPVELTQGKLVIHISDLFERPWLAVRDNLPVEVKAVGLLFQPKTQGLKIKVRIDKPEISLDFYIPETELFATSAECLAYLREKADSAISAIQFEGMELAENIGQ